MFKRKEDDPFSAFSMKKSRPSLEVEGVKIEKGETKNVETNLDDGGKEVVPKVEVLEPESDTKVNEFTKNVTPRSKLDTSRIVVHTIETLEVCVHEVAVPPDIEYKPIKKTNCKPAKEYKFILDPFQKEAILCIENNESVLVSAHTSAGKTVVAEYSIAQSLHLKQRVIYTTPIKALSNQKYREFYEEFQDVGLVTGDVTINPSASCLIMTTEILRSMLYHGSEIMREVSWVIFDEIHYMRDKERGVVWEETLILLPDNVHYVFLSATIPNARQFAEWVVFIHNQPCHVVYTDYRPTPLQHYVFPSGGDGIHLVVNEDGEFLEENFQSAMKTIGNEDDGFKIDAKIVTKSTKNKQNDPACFKVVKMVMERSLAPAIVFSFSKKECEVYAMQMAKLDFLTKEQKKLVDEVFDNAMGVLSEEDRNLPQVENVLPLLRRGIGIHHGGLLPILKETIEVLFAEGLIKALFATETFAMGLNMPARTVIFTSARKFDGRDHRFISSGEYIQMSGRAGRRGLDDKGIVILMVDERVSPSVGKELLQGKADPLNSAFHLTYNMILNLLRVDEINPEYMMERSFYQFQNLAKVPELRGKLLALTEAFEGKTIEGEKEVEAYYEKYRKYEELKSKYCAVVFKPQFILPYLKAGRLIKLLMDDGEESGWGIIINHKRTTTNPRIEEPEVSVDILLPDKEKKTVSVTTHSHRKIRAMSSVRINAPTDVRSKDNLRMISKLLQKIGDRFPDGVPELDPDEDLRIRTDSIRETFEGAKALEKSLRADPIARTDGFAERLASLKAKKRIAREMDETKSEIERAESLLQMDELKRRKRVLRRLKYCTDSDVITMKGRVACEVNSINELVMTELLFSGALNKMSTPQVLSILSCFVCDERSNEQPKMSDETSGALRRLKEIAAKIFRAYKEAKLDVDEDDYMGQFKPTLMSVVHAWCEGTPFIGICRMTDMFEGSIIRCLRRLEELLRQLVMASKSMGNTDMEVRFSQGINLIKRDIVFAASLYL